MKESLGNQPAGGLGGNPVGGLKIMSGVTFPPLQIGTGVLLFFLISAFWTVGVDRLPLANWASSARTRLDVGSIRLGCDSASVLCTLCPWTAHQELHIPVRFTTLPSRQRQCHPTTLGLSRDRSMACSFIRHAALLTSGRPAVCVA
jgi:hypothetical protein